MSNSLVINHNLCALNLIGQINLHQNALSKSIRRLSSGLRINSAADDAAGLCISQRMRGQIAALKQASRNAQDGISFVQTAEGSLEEVHDMLTRMEELTVQAANGTYSETDKKNIQEEIEGLKKAIDHIAGTTRFNGINVFKSSTSNAAINIIFDETNISKYTTIQGTAGGNATGSYSPKFIEQLETQIVPNAIKTLVNAYSAFDYLKDSSIGIGLSLYSDTSTSELAAVTCGIEGPLNNLEVSYNLSVNMASVNWNDATSTITNRSKLESVIAHEMTHALMDEALTCGMFGLSNNGTEISGGKYPTWFTEGFAQAASGPGNWLNSVDMYLTPSSSDAEIKSALAQLTANEEAGAYGAGYLAVTYLGHLASGATGTATASSISTGLDTILSSLISGNSLDTTIDSYTKYTGLSDFTSNFQNDTEAYSFTKNLITQRGHGLGSVITNNLSSSDILDDNAISVNLFKLNSNAKFVTNTYGNATDVYVLSGGNTSDPGIKPINSYPDAPPASHASRPIPDHPTPSTPTDSHIKPITTTYSKINFKIGEGDGEIITYDVPTLSTDSLGISSLNVLNNADPDCVKNAIEKVSTIRGHLGALQNRLEHTYNNLMNTVENLTAAESRIRDADMAKEMMEFSKNNMLVQVGMTLLAQANSMPNNVLQLLRS